MTSSVTNPGKAFARIALALAIAAMGIYVASSDPPGWAVVGFLLMLAAVLFGVRTARSRLPTWAGRTVVAVGALIAAFAAFLIHSIKIEAPLFAQAPGVPSVSASAPSPQLAAAVDRARPMVRAAIVEQNLPGVSIAVGIGGGPGNIVWAEGFGWRDVVTLALVPHARPGRVGLDVPPEAVRCGALAYLGGRKGFSERLSPDEGLGIEGLVEAEEVVDRRVDAAVAGLHALEVVDTAGPIVPTRYIVRLLVKAREEEGGGHPEWLEDLRFEEQWQRLARDVLDDEAQEHVAGVAVLVLLPREERRHRHLL